MSSRQDCKWLPALARRHTVVSSTVSGRSSGKKGPQLFGKERQVGAGPCGEAGRCGEAAGVRGLPHYHRLPLPVSLVLSAPLPSLFQPECFGPLPSLVLPWSPMNFSSGGFTLTLEACKCSCSTPLLRKHPKQIGLCLQRQFWN